MGFSAVVNRQSRAVAGGALLISMILTVPGCRPPEDEPAVAATRTVENGDLHLRLDDLPAAFEVELNEGAKLVLAPADPTIGGRIELLVSPPEDGQNLVSALEFHRVFIDNQEGGTYQGGQELVSPLGTAFYSRGRYVVDGNEIEETVVFVLHPDRDRILRLRYRYPAGVDSSVRVQQLFDVLGSVHGLTAAPPQG